MTRPFTFRGEDTIRDFTHVWKIGIYQTNDLPVGTKALKAAIHAFLSARNILIWLI